MTKYLKLLYQKVYFKYLYSIVWTLVIVYLSLARMPDTEGIKINIPHLDKIVHFTMYFVYTFLIICETKKKNKKSAIAFIALYSILFGTIMEICQFYLFSYRSGDFFDAVFNTLGVLTAIIASPRLIKFIRT